MKKVIVLVVMLLNGYTVTMHGVGPPEFIGNTIRNGAPVIDQKKSRRRTPSVLKMEEELLDELRQAYKESQKEEETCENNTVIPPVNDSASKKPEIAIEIKPLELLANSRLIRDDQKALKIDNDDFRNKLKGLESQLKSMQMNINETHVFSGTCQVLLLLFISAGVISLLAAHF